LGPSASRPQDRGRVAEALRWIQTSG
jgi:hypothetical protein